MQLKAIDAHFLRSMRWSCLALIGILGSANLAHAQSPEPLRNVVQLSASGQVEVEQDWLQMQLTASQQGSDAASVQKRLQQTVDAALRSLKPQAQPREMEVRSGSFGVYPRHDNRGKIVGWQGRADIVLEGTNFARISQAAAQLEDMAVSSMGFGLSKEGRQKVQEQAQAQAIDNFKHRAGLLAQQFGFTGYSLREVHVNSQDGSYAPRMMRANAPMVASAKMEAADAVPVEAGKTQVTVDISGSVQLQ